MSVLLYMIEINPDEDPKMDFIRVTITEVSTNILVRLSPTWDWESADMRWIATRSFKWSMASYWTDGVYEVLDALKPLSKRKLYIELNQLVGELNEFNNIVDDEGKEVFFFVKVYEGRGGKQKINLDLSSPAAIKYIEGRR